MKYKMIQMKKDDQNMSWYGVIDANNNPLRINGSRWFMSILEIINLFKTESHTVEDSHHGIEYIVLGEFNGNDDLTDLFAEELI